MDCWVEARAPLDSERERDACGVSAEGKAAVQAQCSTEFSPKWVGERLTAGGDSVLCMNWAIQPEDARTPAFACPCLPQICLLTNYRVLESTRLCKHP